MPNTKPIIDNVSMVDFIIRRGRDKAPETKKTSETETYDETKHGKREDITYNMPAIH